MEPDELDSAVSIGDIDITECEMVNQFAGSAVKFFGKSFATNAVTWLMLIVLTWCSFGHHRPSG